MAAYLLNLLDLGFTIHALSHGAAELNPVAYAMYAAHPMIYATYKIIVVGALLWVLHRLREYRPPRFGLKVATAVFAVVDLWHSVNIAAAAV